MVLMHTLVTSPTGTVRVKGDQLQESRCSTEQPVEARMDAATKSTVGDTRKICGRPQSSYDAVTVSPSEPELDADPESKSMKSAESSMKSAASSISSQLHLYNGVSLNNVAGSLTFTGERLCFRPQDRRDKTNMLVWQLEALEELQISADSLLLRFVSRSHPQNGAVKIKFSDKASLENIHANLSSVRQQPSIRKYRKIKGTLLTTQRKLKEAYKLIDELQDDNQILLDSCEALGKKCRSLSGQLQTQQHHGIKHFVVNDVMIHEMEKKLKALRQEVEELRTEKIAMAIGHEMDAENYAARIATLENELAEERGALQEERETVERLLDDREAFDELELERHVLSAELQGSQLEVQEPKENMDPESNDTLQKLKELKETVEPELESNDDILWQVRRQRNNAFLELAHVKKQRHELQLELNRREPQKTDQDKKRQHAVDGVDDEKVKDAALRHVCFSSVTLDEQIEDIPVFKEVAASSQLPWSVLGGRLLDVVHAKVSLHCAHLYLPWPFDSVVTPWAMETACNWQTPGIQIFTLGNDKTSYHQKAQDDKKRTIVFTLAKSPIWVSDIYGRGGENQPKQLIDENSLARTIEREDISIRSGECPSNMFRVEIPMTRPMNHDPDTPTGLEGNSLCSQSRHRDGRNGAASVACWQYPFNWSSFIDPLAAKDLWRRPRPEQLCLPDDTPVGGSDKIHMSYYFDILSVD